MILIPFISDLNELKLARTLKEALLTQQRRGATRIYAVGPTPHSSRSESMPSVHSPHMPLPMQGLDSDIEFADMILIIYTH